MPATGNIAPAGDDIAGISDALNVLDGDVLRAATRLALEAAPNCDSF
jgi:hypothetical protein